MTMSWDTDNLTDRVCDIATARRTLDGIVLDFGVRGTDGKSGAFNAECLRTIVLEPEAASALRLLLMRLLERE